ncbi:uncharacterized protein ATNIH1004_005761 [Aspergillus tanneri]|uniref:Uncharacterized protein n=1 Tax=Aspergillus tanneri TaxID=1220188 RepID=A0A5M9MJ96_9EURO|nr:uncharacterized protein ATNIH1004_005761 [Aspergillus tanneri]KAA8647078.1 hypothetical protein ATNIH1004_005761 [Aspergillus tanneri]
MGPRDESELFLKDPHQTPKQISDPESRNIFRHRTNLNLWFLSSHSLVFIFTSLLWGSLFYTMDLSLQSRKSIKPIDETKPLGNITTKAKLLTCGWTPEEAKALGCQYDILSNHWVPGLCMDQKAVEEYQTDESWFGFADENRTELLSIDTMSEMKYYYTSERDHIVHCAMLWRKQFRAFFEERDNLDTIIADSEHTMHCSQFLMDMSDKGPDYRNMPIKTWVGYAGCWVKE